MAKWRLLVLILIHLVMVAHLLQWLYQGVTISPVEPSESMYTLEAGELNAGFIMFCVAIIATLVFGRFFCGWACHVVALQDACTWFMNKVGIRPKPFRSRLLVWSGLLLAIYMFVWPTFKRDIISPISRWMTDHLGAWFLSNVLHAPQIQSIFNHPPRGFPYLFGEDNPFPGFKNSLIVEDFWSTFPEWYIAIPFLLTCGGMTVYFLGNKGFCTYGCPYGGFFAPVDRFSIGRIVVNDNCEGCGHCTAVCTSNVRVHQEVRDFGQVMDVGCMKCMDCVSVCPNQALSFKIAKPAFLVKPRTPGPQPSKVRRPDYDLTIPEEFVVFALALALFLCFRGMFNQVPMLMAVSMGAIGAFCAWTLWRILRVPNVRLQNLQLRVKGRVTRTGMVFALLTLAYLAAGAWSGFVRANRVIGDYLDQSILTSQSVVFAPGYTPQPDDNARALDAIAYLERGGPRQFGGLGWGHSPAAYTRLAWLHAVAGNRDASETYVQHAALVNRPGPALISGIATIMRAQGRDAKTYESFLQSVLAKFPDAHHARMALANLYLGNNRRDEALAQIKSILDDVRGADEDALVAALSTKARVGQIDEVLRDFPEVLRLKPNSASLRALRGAVAMIQNQPQDAVGWFDQALKRSPGNAQFYLQQGQVLVALGREGEARKLFERLNKMLTKLEREQEVVSPDERIRLLKGR